MSQIGFKVLLSILLLACLLGPVPAQAQGPQNILIIYPAVEDAGDSLALSVFFVVTDLEGRPLTDVEIESAEVELLRTDKPPVTALVGDPQTPFYVVLLMDASGSMAGVMPQVREAAQAAIDSAPPTAQFNVSWFSDKFQAIPGFTNDHQQVRDRIARIESITLGSTCLYDATSDAVSLLDDTISEPQERRAIILFTDGKDEKADGSACSIIGYNDVIKVAHPLGKPVTPIHTIGLCGDAECSNIDTVELRNMAADTLAFSARGQADQLQNLFGEIMDGLNSQQVAQAKVYASQGENEAALLVKLRNGGSLSTTFSFFSEKDYAPPAAPFAAQITTVAYDEVADLYKVALSLISPEQAQQVMIQILDTKSGIQVPPDQTFDNPGPTIEFEREATGLEPGREYIFRVRAVDKTGAFIQTAQGNPILAEWPVTYEPPQVEVVQVAVESVNADYDNNKLIIDLNVANPEQVESYTGYILDTNAGAKVAEFGPTLYTEQQLLEALPETIGQGLEPGEYQVVVTLLMDDGQQAPSVPYPFKPSLRPRLTFMQRVGQFVIHPATLVGFSLLVIGLSVAIFLYRRPRQTTLPPPLRPPVDITVYEGPTNPPSYGSSTGPERVIPSARPQPLPRLRLKVVEPAGPEKTINNYPCTIGREQSCHLVIPDEEANKTVSRKHLQITVQGGELFLTDLGSKFGTFLGEVPLKAHTPTKFQGTAKVRLGKRTHLQIDTQT